MWEKFKMSLGKFVQGVLNIFKKKKKNNTQEWDCVTFTVGAGSCDEMHLGPGQVTIMPLGEIPATFTWEKPKSYVGKKPETFSDLSDEEYEELKNLVNTYLTDLPKRIHVPTLIVSTYASWDYDSVGVDLSQLEETGIAHYWCTSTRTMAEHMDDFRNRHPEEEEWEEDGESSSIIVKDTYLTEWPKGVWTWE